MKAVLTLIYVLPFVFIYCMIALAVVMIAMILAWIYGKRK
jgi:hypothetical protein